MSEEEKTRDYAARFLVGPAYAGYRLDQFIGRMIPKLSRNRVQKLIANRVRLSWQTTVKASTPVREGGQVFIDDEEIREETIEFDPAIVFEDEDVLAIDKPPGIVVHPTHSHLRNTVITLLRRQRDEKELTLAHRIDAETSGVLLLGRHRWAARKLQLSFEKGRVEKVYLALAFGETPEEFTVELPLGYHSEDTVVYRQRPDAAETKSAKTIFRRRELVGPYSLLEAQLVTGRRHQIRAHLAFSGYPIVGDKLYALDDRDYRRYLHAGSLDDELRAKLVASRSMLHCHRMALPHPRHERGTLEMVAAMPADMAAVIEAARRAD